MRSLGFSVFSRYDGDGIRRARRDVDDFTRSVNRSSSAMNSSSGRFALYAKAIAAFGPALVPISGSLLQIAGAATTMGVSVGASLTAYGAALKGATQNASAHAGAVKSAKAELDRQKAALDKLTPGTQAYRDQLQKVAAAQKAYEASLRSFSPAQRQYIQATTEMSSAWQKFVKANESKTLDTATHAVRGLTAGVGLLQPMLDAAHPAVNQLAKDFENWMKGDRAKQYANIIASITKQSLPDLIAAGKNVANVLGDGFRAFAKDAGGIAESIRKGSESLKTWSDGGGFQRFIQWAHDNGPAVKDFFKALGDALNTLFQAFKGLGPFALTLTTTILKLVAALPPSWIDAVVKGFIAWKVAMAGLMIIQTVIGLVNALRVAWFTLSLAFSASAIGLVVIAIAALIAGIILLIQNWSTVSGALAAAWNATWNAMKVAVEAVWMALQTAWNATVNFFISLWNTVSGALVGAWNAVWNGMSVAVQAVWLALQTAWNAVVNAFQIVWITVSAALTAAWNAVWNGLSTAAQAIWSALQAAWNAVCTAFSTVWSAVSGALTAAWNAVWNALSTAAQAVWNALRTAWSTFLTAVQTTWSAISAALSAAWNVFWNAIRTAAQTVWTAIQAAWSAFLTAIQTIWSTVSAALSAAWSAAWNAIRTAAQSVWDAIRGAWDTFLNGIQQAWDTASSALQNAVEAAWNAIKDTAQKIWDDITNVIKDAVNGIIDIINTIGDGINAVSSAVGLGDIIPNIGGLAEGGVLTFAYGGITGAPANFARGGVIPGYAPGKDTVNAMLSKGEGVLVPEAVKGLGSDFVHWANYHFSHGRGGKNVNFPGYAEGGVNLPGSVRAWHRTGPAEGWNFQGGGIVFPTPGGGAPVPTGPGIPRGTGNAPETDDLLDNQDDGGGSILGVIKDIVGTITGLGTGTLGAIGGNLVLGFIQDEVFDKIANAALDVLGGFNNPAGKFGEMLMAAVKKIIDAAIDFLKQKNEEAKKRYEAMAVAGSQSVQAWAPLAAQALALAGLSPSQLPAFLALMQAESGGNPNAINLWDSNAAAGMPSQGLMQVIPPTFAAYHVAGTSNNILDPLANMAASAAYIKSRYGGIVPGSPYADGTDSATPGVHLVGEEGPELVTQPGFQMFGGGEQVLSAPDTASLLSGASGGAAGPVAGGASGMAGGGSPLGSAGQVGDSAEVQALIQSLIASAQVLQDTIAAMWAKVIASTNTSWQTMNGQTFVPLTTVMTGTVPAGMGTMSAAFTAGMTALAAGTVTQWTSMNTAAFTPMNAMMTTTVPTSADTMNTSVTGSTQQMQTSVQGSWDQMQAGTEQSWTGIQTSITDSVTAATGPINGLLEGFNNVSSSLGMGVTVPLIAFADGGVAGFAKGGMLAKKGGALPGFRPGKDTIPAMLSPGEGVLTPEAVRGLGGPGFVYAANRKWSGHRGGGQGGRGRSFGRYGRALGFSVGGMAALPGGILGTDGRMHFMSGTITAQDQEGLAEAGVSASLVTQGSFSTGVAASAGTHDGDGVLDFGSTSVEGQLRNGGWAAWTRGNGDGMAPHTHGVYMRASGMSPAAMWQVIDFINGGSGLGVGSGSSSELAGWGLGLGRWDFGPLIKDLVDVVKTTVPPLLRPIVLKKLTADQVASGFADKKAAIDAMSVGTGPWSDGLHGMGNKSHQGVVDYISSRATAMDRGGWMQPGMNHIWNGTGKPELATPADDLKDIADGIRGGNGRGASDCVHVEFNFNGPVNNGDDVRRAIDEAIPKLRSAVQARTGARIGG